MEPLRGCWGLNLYRYSLMMRVMAMSYLKVRVQLERLSTASLCGKTLRALQMIDPFQVKQAVVEGVVDDLLNPAI